MRLGFRLHRTVQIYQPAVLRRQENVGLRLRGKRGWTRVGSLKLGSLQKGLPLRFEQSRWFSCNNALSAEKSSSQSDGSSTAEKLHKRKQSRSGPGTTSLRRVAVEAQRSRDGLRSPGVSASAVPSQAKVRQVTMCPEWCLPGSLTRASAHIVLLSVLTYLPWSRS